MRVVVLYNPNSGRGRGQRVAESVRALLERKGLSADLLATAKEPPDAFRQRLKQALAGAGLMVVAGGDGTLHSTLPALVGSGVPVYHLAMGTENLFARQFGMDQRPETLEAALDKAAVVDVDVGALTVDETQTPFALMCSVGPDASIIRRLDQERQGPISHLSYLRPVLAELVNPWLPRLTIDVDGQRVVDGQPGMVVVANSRQYAVRIDPAHRASMTDGLLDVVYLPCRGPATALLTFARCRLRRQSRATVYRHGRTINIHAEDPRPAALQIDGECRRVAQGRLDLKVEVWPRSLRVLAG